MLDPQLLSLAAAGPRGLGIPYPVPPAGLDQGIIQVLLVSLQGGLRGHRGVGVGGG